MSDHTNDELELALLRQRVDTLEGIALRTEPMLAQILAAVEALKMMMSHATENHKALSERVSDHEIRMRSSEAKTATIGDHEARIRTLEKAESETWYIKPLSYALFIGCLGAISAALWKLLGH